MYINRSDFRGSEGSKSYIDNADLQQSQQVVMGLPWKDVRSVFEVSVEIPFGERGGQCRKRMTGFFYKRCSKKF